MTQAKISKRSYLILIGGAEDKKRDKKILRLVVDKSQAKNVIVISSASSYPYEVARDYDYAFRDIGVEKVTAFDIRYPDEADKEEYFEQLAEAQLIFFSGGDQVKQVKALQGSQLIEKIRERFFAGTLTIAGTSAGAASAANPMIYDGDYRGFQKDTVNYSEGFGWLEGITIDTHFLNRQRIARLAQFLSSGKSKRGIGIDEDTAIVISPDMKFEVVGSGMVTLMSRDRTTNTNYQGLENNDYFSVNNLKIGFLAPGSSFSLQKWMMLKKRKILKKIPV